MKVQYNRDEDKIDLRELFKTLKKNKKLIFLVTGIITTLAILYAYVLAKPIYEVKAVIEIGKIKEGNPLDNIGDVKQKLEYLYGVNSKKKREYPRVKSINISKKSKSIFTIVVEGKENQSAIQKIEAVVHKLEHDYAEKVNTYINTQKEFISLTKNDIEMSQKNLKNAKKTLEDYNSRMLHITEKDAALAGLYVMQISQNQSRIQGLESHISALKTKAFNLKLSIAPLRITKTHIVGNIEVLSKPVKPKKVLIVIVASITGVMLSIFLVFFLYFLRNEQ